MKYLIFLCFFPSFAYAANEVTAFEHIMQNLQDITDFFTIGIPDLVSRTVAYVIEFSIYLKIQSYVFMLQLASDVARHILLDLNITSNVNAAFASIPPDIGYFLNKFLVPDCVTFLFECYTTRFVMSMMGW